MRSVLLLALVVLALPTRAQILPDLTGEVLREALVADYAPTAVLSSSASKDVLYSVIDSTTVDGTLGTVGLYTGFFAAFDCDPSCDPSQDVFNQPNENTQGINQEHVWPRARGAGSGRAETDLHHLFPTKVNVNSDRGNLPFGEIDDALATTWYVLDQSQGTPPPEDSRDAWSELRADVRFEPREEKKGDVARAMFYFYTMYGPDGTGQADDTFFEGMKETLLAWHEADSPTVAEVARSERVAAYQSTGSSEPAINPFVHDATLVRRAFFPTAVSPIVYVNAAAVGAQTGSSWTDAFLSLQDALDYAEAHEEVEEVWVARATYFPTKGGGRDATFRLRSGLALYGGFDGTETDPSERDWSNGFNLTRLSGDIGAPFVAEDNVQSIVTADTVVGVVLDGFMLRNGYSDSNTLGGALTARASELTVRRCWFDDNRGVFGGAIHLIGGTYAFEDVSASFNYAEPTDDVRASLGGALYAVKASLSLDRTTFLSNTLPFGEAGALYTIATDLEIRASLFAGNTASRGGAIRTALGEVLIDSTEFTLNESTGSGGAIDSDSPLTILRSRFVSNSASGDPSDTFSGAVGGAINSNGYTLKIISSAFVDNKALGANATEGGAVAVGPTEGVLIANAFFAGNRAESSNAVGSSADGGAISMRAARSETSLIVNSTIVSNGVAAENVGAGGVALAFQVPVRNTILWGNDGGQLSPPPNADVAYSLIEGGYPGTQILTAAPLFRDATGGDYHLTSTSPALNYGSEMALPPDTHDLDGDGDTEEPLPLDLDGNPRVQGSAPDLGAYESPFTVTSELTAGIPLEDGLGAPYPNPARTQARFVLSLAEAREAVTVAAFDVLGRRVAVLHDGPLAAGQHPLTLDGTALPAGVYLVRSTARGFAETQRVVLIR